MRSPWVVLWKAAGKYSMNFEQFKEQFDVRLNDQQEKAVLKTEGPALLLAVPGSGKTTVIVARVGYMIHCCGIRPSGILTLTFSKAAAVEMGARFARKFGQSIQLSPVFGTINSFCLSIIRKAHKEYGVSIPKLEPNSGRIVRRVFFDIVGRYPSESETTELQQAIGFCKNMMYTIVQIEGIQFPDLNFHEFYDSYEQFKTDNHLMDFDDQLTYAYELIEEYPELLRSFHRRYKYINVDEAQDTSYIQHKLIEKMVGSSLNIFMVGDEDQSIYGFRAAYPEALTQFSKTYQGAEILLIERNYRCAESITAAADRFIKRNRNRHDKSMVAERSGGKIYQTKLKDLKHQYRHILSEIKDKDKDKEVAVLYRNNESVIPLVDLLETEGIPYVWDANLSFFDSFVVKDIMSALKLALNPRDIVSYGELYYKLGLYTRKANYLHIMFQHSKRPEADVFTLLANNTSSDDLRGKVFDIADALSRAGKRTPVEAIDTILRLFYNAWMRQLSDDRGYALQTLRQKVSTLYAVAMEYKSVDEYISRMEGLRKLKSKRAKEKSGAVTLSTIHSSKGLEFDKVILMDILKDILPIEGRPSDSREDDEKLYSEEVRLFYVGITRARNEVEIITSDKRFGEDVAMSPFVRAILGRTNSQLRRAPNVADSAEHNYEPGSRVNHTLFGEGTVTSQTGDIISVRFDDCGNKRLLLSACIKWGYL